MLSSKTDSRIQQSANSLRHQCPLCSKSYKRREHLQRHWGTHGPARPYSCPCCSSSFKRADVLKRHSKTCEGRTPGLPKTPNTRRRACDRCVQQKTACNSGHPCRSCAKRAVACLYTQTLNQNESQSHASAVDAENGFISNHDPLLSPTGLTTPLDFSMQEPDNSMGKAGNTFSDLKGPNYSNEDWGDLLALISEGQLLPDPTLSQALNHHSLTFLDSITKDAGLVHSFECGTQEQREQVLRELELQPLCDNLDESVSTLSSHPITEDDCLNIPGQEILGLLDTPKSWSQVWLDNPLSLKTHEILLLVKAVIEVKPRNSPVELNWSPALENECLQFFSPSNLCRLLGLYWAIWHPNVNFVHRPTFDPMSAKPTLLAAMALIGAIVSPSRTDNENARVWFNCVEEIVFTDEDFNSDLTYFAMDRVSVHRRTIQSLQAAYMVCLYQNWEGTDCSKNRIRRFRFAILVSTARDINIATATHVNYCKTQCRDFRWSDFAAREELIRVFIWIFLLDTAFVIFNNAPPRMTIKEMKMHMAVPEACFQAMTADECSENIQSFLPGDSPYWDISFRSAFENLCKSCVPPTTLHVVGSLGPLNLFALASAIHCLVFQHRNSFDGCQLPSAIQNSLGNWKVAWDVFFGAYSSNPSAHITIDNTDLRPDNMWKRVGFNRFCPEYWLLASLIVDQLIVRDTSGERSDQYTHGQGPNPLYSSVPGKILDKYDQPSMRQINDLIGELQQFQIV